MSQDPPGQEPKRQEHTSQEPTTREFRYLFRPQQYLGPPRAQAPPKQGFNLINLQFAIPGFKTGQRAELLSIGAQTAGLPGDVGMHSLRHSAAVHALDAGLSTEDVRDLLRHKRIATTDVYANLSTRRRGDYLRKLESSNAVVKLN